LIQFGFSSYPRAALLVLTWILGYALYDLVDCLPIFIIFQSIVFQFVAGGLFGWRQWRQRFDLGNHSQSGEIGAIGQQ
jgi:hypothetical protein